MWQHKWEMYPACTFLTSSDWWCSFHGFPPSSRLRTRSTQLQFSCVSPSHHCCRFRFALSWLPSSVICSAEEKKIPAHSCADVGETLIFLEFVCFSPLWLGYGSFAIKWVSFLSETLAGRFCELVFYLSWNNRVTNLYTCIHHFFFCLCCYDRFYVCKEAPRVALIM